MEKGKHRERLSNKVNVRKEKISPDNEGNVFSSQEDGVEFSGLN